MKSLTSVYFACLIFIVGFNSCKKDNTAPTGTSALTIVNAMVGSSSVVTNFDQNVTLKYYTTAQEIGYGSFWEFSGYNGIIPLALSDYSDTTKAIYSQTLNFASGSIHSLFLCGTLATPDNFLTTDILPFHSANDSSMSIRFVNLSTGSGPVSVDIQGNANGSEINTLSYKGISPFKTYSAKSNISSYTFEFRDVVSGTVLGTYTINGVNNGDGSDTNPNPYRWHDFTVAIYDVPGNQNVMLINNY